MNRPAAACVYFVSERAPTLWALAVLTALPPALAVWLLSLTSNAATDAEFGASWIAWLWRIGLVLFSAVLFLSMAWLSGRYVLRAERLADGRMRFVVWTLLGRRDRLWPGWPPIAPIAHVLHRESLGPIFRLRALIRLALRGLVGRRNRLWPGGPVEHEGRTHIPGRVWVDAPYISVHPLRGGQLIVDLQGTFPHGVNALFDAMAS